MVQLSLLSQHHNNQYLFSDYYLNNRVAEQREWRDTDVHDAFAQLRDLWAATAASLDNANESQTEEVWIKPVLAALGFPYTVQVALSTPQGTKQPDYILCADDAQRIAIQTHDTPLSDIELTGALAVADAKAWNRPLDRGMPDGDVHTLHENPGLQIDFYIRHSGLNWGLLTNGRQWRLYQKDSSKKLDVFYEVDLPALLESDDPESFKYFWLFFRRQAFLPDMAASNGQAWLERVLDESQSYEQGVSDGLKRQVYDAISQLAQGFIDFPGNDLTPDLETRQAIYDNSLIILYRLLFILYAEDRNLLPIDSNATYRDTYSLQALKRQVARDLDSGLPASPAMSTLWNKLIELWTVIDRGDEQYLGVPAYNGGLFKPENHPFLTAYRVGDLHLRDAIDQLARIIDPQTGLREFVDYRDLEIRHLGSIYEGLLEYQLEVAEQPLAERRVKGTTVIEPASPSAATIGTGQVYLITDKGERKATGSYYTPDYIVQYIVEQTVGPVLETTAAPFLDEAGNVTDAIGLIAALLAVNVLDPAMGSGHFLVAATDFIARRFVEWGLAGEGMAENDGESQLAYWKRRVAQACIYGVDLNPLAVELAKLGMWLNTVSRDRPLSFLDHHLRYGNSLIGARVADLPLDGAAPKKQSRHQAKQEERARVAGQMSMLSDSAFAASMMTATGMMDLIESLGSETLEDVHEAERIYRKSVRDVTAKARTLADLWTARYFGLEIPEDQWPHVSRYILHGGAAALTIWKNWIEEGRAIAADRRFFHWELEFPEVFFNATGQLQEESAGFDAVIGNPPYVRSVRLKDLDLEAWAYYSRHFNVAKKGEFDIYLCFVELGLDLLNVQSRLGMIVPNKWFTTNVGYGLRELLAASECLSQLVDFGAFQVFQGVTTYTCLCFLSGTKSQTAEIFKLEAASQDSDPMPGFHGRWQQGNIATSELDAHPWNFTFGLTKKILNQLSSFPKLDDFTDIFMGTGTRADAIFQMVHDDSRFFSRSLNSWVEIEPDIMKPSLTGRDIESYYTDTGSCLLFPYEFQNQSVHLMSAAQMSSRYPKAWQYLNHPTNVAILEARDKGKYADDPEWYGYGRPQNMEKLGERKILFPDVTNEARFAWDDIGYHVIDTAYCLQLSADTPYSYLTLLTILNSSVLTFFLEQTGTDLRGGYFRMKTAYLKPFPVPTIHFTTPADERAALAGQSQALYVECATTNDSAPLLAFSAAQLSHAPERSDVVHDLLAFLAEQMIDLNKQRQKLERALDPFKYFNLSATVEPLAQVFADAIKYGELVNDPDLRRVHHDVEAVRLVDLGSGRFTLQALLKHRDPATDWAKFAYDSDRGIVRRWETVYRFDLSEEIARFYAQALPIRERFSNAKNFPGGKSSTTLEKLHKGVLPVFDPAVDVTPLEELQAELSAIRTQIANTDCLIDQLVYQLYGLSDEEIAIVEGRGA